MNKKKWLVSGVTFILILGVIVGIIWWNKITNMVRNNPDVLKVIILDSEEYYYSDSGIDNGIRMALQEIQEEGKVSVELEVVDDGGDYVKGISMAQELANDPTVDVVISFQNFEAIGSEAEIFDKAGKPFIVTMGCYDKVAENGYKYFLADFLSGQAIGARIGEYLEEQKVSNITLCHSDTVFEKDEVKGLQSEITDTEGITVRDIMVGPFHKDGLATLLTRCEQFQIDAIVANFYEQEDSAWLISQLRTKRPDLIVVGDYALDSTEILGKYGRELEGTVIIPAYPYVESQKLKEFIKEYEAFSGQRFSTAAVQYYDLFYLLADSYEKVGDQGRDLMQQFKSKEGYEGIAGEICFDSNGRLQVEECPVFICRNGEMVFYTP